MILIRSNDILQTGLCRPSRIRIIRVDVTDTARALERRHLCGPTAALALGEALAAVALLGAETSLPGETITFRMSFDGPVGGLVAEAGSDGTLRGYPNVKIIHSLDDRDEPDLDGALGEEARVQVVRSTPGKILARTSLAVRPASVESAIEQYYTRSDQRDVRVALSALYFDNGLFSVRGLSLERLPDGDREEFDRLQRIVAEDSALEALEDEDGLRDLAEALGLNDPRIDPSRTLRFACRCSRERVETMLASLTEEDLQELLTREGPVRIFCHMCGEGYEIEAHAVKQLLEQKRRDSTS